MSIQREVQIYTYTLNILNLTLKIKFPCKIYLEHAGNPITNEVSTSSPNKFTFNQEVTLKNETEKEYIEVLVQLVTDKGAKYVGGVLKFIEKELIGSQGERIVVPIAKCLDNEAVCEVRVDQVATSRIFKKQSGRKAKPQKTQFHPDLSPLGWNANKNKLNQGQTKSEFNMPLAMGRKELYDIKIKEPTIGGQILMRKNRPDMDKDPTMSVAGMSSIEFEVYKEGYNKLKDKYRKEAENARSELNKRMALESNQNNLKLEIMRYKLKTEQLEKTLNDKNQKIKEFTEALSNFQKKQLDIKYMKEQIQNKNYTIKNLQETIKALTKDNSQLKNLQNLRQQNQQQAIKGLKDDLERVKKQLQSRESQLLKEIKKRDDTISKKQYELHNKSDELERAKCLIQDLQTGMSNKIFEVQKIQQGDKTAAKIKHDELKERITKLQSQRNSQDQKIKELQQKLQEKKNQTVRVQYDKRVLLQNYQSLQKQIQELKLTREKYLELVRQHKLVGQQKTHIEKTKQREHRLKDSHIEEINQKYNQLNETTRKIIKDLQDKLKVNQLKLIQVQSQNQLLRNQQDKAKRQNQLLNKENVQIKIQLRDFKSDAKDKEEKLLILTNQLSDAKNKFKQGDYSSKLDQQRQRSQVQKLTKLLEEQLFKTNELTQTISRFELEINKSKMEWQFKQQKASKQIGYAKEKHTNLESVKFDLQTQLSAASVTITNFKTNEKNLNEKIQKLQLEAIKSKQNIQKFKKDIKVLEQKLQNSENNIKAKSKQLSEHLEHKQNLDKQIGNQETDISQLKNSLNMETNEKARNQKMVEILQSDLTKAKEQHTRLNSVINAREKKQEEVREELKKQKQQYTKLDMRLSALKKQYEKFKETLVENLHTTFTSIPEGSLNSSSSSIKQSKVGGVDKANIKQNSQILNLLTTFGKQTRNNMNKVLDNLKIAQRDHQKLNSQFTTTVNKSSTSEFQLNQTVNRLQEEISELHAEKQNSENKFEEEIFLLQGRVRQKEALIGELTQQVEQLDFAYKNTRGQFQAFREDTSKKQSTKNKLVNELREQIQYQLTSMSLLENNQEKLNQQLNSNSIFLQQYSERNHKLEKQLLETKESLHIAEEDCASLKRQFKKANQKIDELTLELGTQREDAQKLKGTIEDEERKAAELRQFVNGLMKQKETIIKKQLQKSQQVLQHETKIQQLKHQNEWLGEQLKKYRKVEEQLRQNIKRLTKSFKDQQLAKHEEKNKHIKVSQKLKQKQKQGLSKDEVISRLEEKLKKEKEKANKDIKQLEFQLDETYAKLLNKEKQSNQKIISLESENEKLKAQSQKLHEQIVINQQLIFTEKSKLENISGVLFQTEKNLNEAVQRIKVFQEKVRQLEEQIHFKQEDNYKLQGKVYSLESKFEQNDVEKNERIQSLHGDWLSKYEGVIEEYEQRLELIQKQKLFLKERIEEKDRQIKKISNQVKLQENNVTVIKKGFEEKIKSLEEDRFTVLSQKNTQNQRLIEQNRINFQNLKAKESQCRKINSELQLSKATSSKLEIRLKETEQKIKSLNRAYQSEVEQLKKKEQSFKRIKETVVSSIWKSQREVRKVIQGSIKKLLEIVDEQSTTKVVEVTKALEQNVISAISIRMEQKQNQKQ